MILGRPTLQNVLKFIKARGCPLCGERPVTISIGGPDEIVPICGHKIDAKDWIESQYEEHEYVTTRRNLGSY